MEVALYALFLVLIVIIFWVKKRDKSIKNETHYLRAYFDIMDLPVEQRLEKLERWEVKALNQAYPDFLVFDDSSDYPDNVVSIHKAI